MNEANERHAVRRIAAGLIGFTVGANAIGFVLPLYVGATAGGDSLQEGRVADLLPLAGGLAAPWLLWAAWGATQWLSGQTHTPDTVTSTRWVNGIRWLAIVAFALTLGHSLLQLGADQHVLSVPSSAALGLLYIGAMLFSRVESLRPAPRAAVVLALFAEVVSLGMTFAPEALDLAEGPAIALSAVDVLGGLAELFVLAWMWRFAQDRS